jgi:hypothetical protein
MVAANLGPKANGRLANLLRDTFRTSSNPVYREAALQHYDRALETAADRPELVSWLLCHRLQLSLTDLELGLIDPGDFEDEVDAARSAASDIGIRYTIFKRRTIKWLGERLDELYEPAETDSPDREAMILDLADVAIISAMAPENRPLALPA